MDSFVAGHVGKPRVFFSKRNTKIERDGTFCGMRRYGTLPDSAISFSSMENAFDDVDLFALVFAIEPPSVLTTFGVWDGDDT